MENYNFWQDFFATYRSSPDAIKALWLIIPPTFAVAIAGLALKALNKRPDLNIVPEIADGEPVQNGANEEVLVFVGGRLLDRYGVPAKPITTVNRQDTF